MKAKINLEVVLLLIAALCIIAAVVMTQCYTVAMNRIEKLELSVALLTAELATIDQPPESMPVGGHETEPPPSQTVHSEWTFPVAESDYLMPTSPFGYRISPILNIELYHWGVDIASTWRAQVVAVADGTVIEHWPPPGTQHPSGKSFRGHDIYGGMLLIEHSNGWRSLYAHMSETRVHTGWTVQAGQVIGRVGSTGRSRGEHLHIELHDSNGNPVNPLLYLIPGKEEQDI